MFTRVAVVNRGEPAMRLIRAVRELNEEHGYSISVVALHTEAASGWELLAFWQQQANDVATRQAFLEVKVPDKDKPGEYKSLEPPLTAQCIHDQPCNGCRWNTRGFGRLKVHDLPESRVAARWPKIVALSASEIFNERTCFTQSIIPIS